MCGAIRTRLFEISDNEYKSFSAKLIPNINDNCIIGVRLPELRKIAKEIVFSNSWEDYLNCDSLCYFEEYMLQGMVIGSLDVDLEERLIYIKDFLPKIDNWSVCDSFCSSLKFTSENQKKVWNFILPLFFSEQEYNVRFAVVMSLQYYINEEYFKELLDILDSVEHQGYYVKTAVAWAVLICYIRFPEKTFEFLQMNSLDNFTYNLALQKITESRRVRPEIKSMIGKMKRKKLK